MVSLILPFVSPKAYSKLHPVTSIFDLNHTYGLPLSGIRLPLAVLEEEARLRLPVKSTWTSSVTSALGMAASYIPFSGMNTSSASHNVTPSSKSTGEGYWGNTIDKLVEKFQGVPPLFDELRDVILEQCVTTEGIFRRAPGVSLLLSSVRVQLMEAASPTCHYSST